MDIINEGKFKKLCRVADVSTESQADYTLPDYLGDVRKVLFTTCEAKQAGKFSDENGDEFSGIVAYEVVYLDSENKLSSAGFTSDYDLRHKSADQGKIAAFATPSATSYNVRLTGPRRLSARATVSASVKCIAEDEISVSGSTFACETEPQTLEGVLKIRNISESEPIEREFAERVERLDGVIEDETRVIYCGAEVLLDDARAEDDRGSIKGEIILYALLSIDEAPLYLASKTVEFDEAVPFVGVSADMHLIPRAEVRSVTASVNADEAGCEVVVSSIVELSCVAEYNTPVLAKEDVYLTCAEVNNTYRDYKYNTLGGVVKVSEACTAELRAEELSAEKIRDIPYLKATVKVENVSREEGEAVISGELRCVGVASVIDENGEISYTGLRFALPIEQRVTLGGASESEELSATLEAHAVSALLDTSTVKINYKLTGELTSAASLSKKLLTSSEAAEPIEAERGRITVYYPTDADTLFSVAKKYKTKVAKLSHDNDIAVQASAGDVESLGGVSRLIIF